MSDAFYDKIFDLYKRAPGTNTIIPGGPSPTDPLACIGLFSQFPARRSRDGRPEQYSHCTTVLAKTVVRNGQYINSRSKKEEPVHTFSIGFRRLHGPLVDILELDFRIRNPRCSDP